MNWKYKLNFGGFREKAWRVGYGINHLIFTKDLCCRHFGEILVKPKGNRKKSNILLELHAVALKRPWDLCLRADSSIVVISTANFFPSHAHSYNLLFPFSLLTTKQIVERSSPPLSHCWPLRINLRNLVVPTCPQDAPLLDFLLQSQLFTSHHLTLNLLTTIFPNDLPPDH